MHQFVRARPLGGQQLRRLRELREAGDNNVRERHLKRDGGVSAPLQQPGDALVSRTVDAIVYERQQDRDGVSTSARLRDKVTAARRGMQTERSERKQSALRPVEKVKTTRKIAAVRRRGEATSEEEDRSAGRRRMGKQEAEWIEKQLQYSVRAATLEKECQAAWLSFFAGAGTSASSGGFVSTIEVNKLIEEVETLRGEVVQKMKQELRKLSSKANDVQMKVEEIQNGGEFLSELQERIDAMETALAKFRLSQRKLFEENILEEKMLEKELAIFMENMNDWENEPPPSLGRGGASTACLGPRLIHLGSEAKLDEHHVNLSRMESKSNNDETVDQCCGTNQSEDRATRAGASDELGMVNRVRRLNDAILRSGGLKGGWDSREHATFTTLLVKCSLSDDILLQHLFPSDKASASNQESHHDEPSQQNCSDYETQVARFLRKCMRKVVTQTESSVRSHFEWYLRHLELVEEKKRVIQEWKVRKEQERQLILQFSFDADGEVLESLARGGIPEASRDPSSRNQSKRIKLKSREKTDRLLEKWKLEKKQKDEEQKQRRRELQKKREAVEAKRKQEQLDAKQKILLYKLQKEQEAMMLDRTTKFRQESATEDGLQTGPLPFVSPTSKEDLVERSRIAIEYAKAKRLRLQQIEERRQKQIQLPPRPESNETANTSPKPVLVFNPTEASKARELTKDELRKKARLRERQSAHDGFIPGEKAIPDAKFKSFGHLPIQPRAVPAWRKNI
ncbi:hypothetical protein PRIC2_007201 [Phytophthora ramorum]